MIDALRILCYLHFTFLLTPSTSPQISTRPLVLWLDAHANMERLGTPEKVAGILERARSAGVTEVVIDFKGIDGHVLYRSAIAPYRWEWEGMVRDTSFDYLAFTIEHARRLGMKAHLSMNVFAEGFKAPRAGRAYEDSTIRSWAVVAYSPNGRRPIAESDEEIAVFVDPALDTVRRYELAIMEEAVRRYRPDGIILDRARYAGITTSFSDASRSAFERWHGAKVTKWPEDILSWPGRQAARKDYVRGPLFKAWVEWRATVIASFFREARARVKAVDPSIVFGDYVGAWYPPYFEVGVNWASRRYDPSSEFHWATPTYRHTGYADDLDVLMVGTYFYEVAMSEVPEGKETWYSVEGSADIARRVTAGAVPVYGSLYVEQYHERNDPEQFVRAIKMLKRRTDGVMIFDLVHIDRYDWWEVLERAWREDR